MQRNRDPMIHGVNQQQMSGQKQGMPPNYNAMKEQQLSELQKYNELEAIRQKQYVEDQKKQKEKSKKKGGWFSCFSSAAEDKNLDIAKKAQQNGPIDLKHRDQSPNYQQNALIPGMHPQMQPNIQAIQEPMYPNMDFYDQKPVKGVNDLMYSQGKNSMGNGSQNNELDRQQFNTGSHHNQNGSFANQSLNGMNNLNSSVNDLDQLRQESKLRIKSGVPYQPNNDISTQSNTRTQQPGYKDISYYTGSGAKQKRGLNNKQPSNMEVGSGRMQNFQPQQQPQVNLRNKDARSNSNLKTRKIEEKPHTVLAYKGRDRSPRRQSPTRFPPNVNGSVSHDQDNSFSQSRGGKNYVKSQRGKAMQKKAAQRRPLYGEGPQAPPQQPQQPQQLQQQQLRQPQPVRQQQPIHVQPVQQEPLEYQYKPQSHGQPQQFHQPPPPRQFQQQQPQYPPNQQYPLQQDPRMMQMQQQQQPQPFQDPNQYQQQPDLQNFYNDAPVTEDMDFRGVDESEISAVHVEHRRAPSRAIAEDQIEQQQHVERVRMSNHPQQDPVPAMPVYKQAYTPQPQIRPENKAYRQSAQSRMMGVPPPEIQQEMPSVKSAPSSNYSQGISDFWTPQIINLHKHIPSYFELVPQQYPLSENQERQMIQERYNSILHKYDNIRAQMYDDLEREFQDSFQTNDPMDQDQYEDAKQEIHWDVAWQVFDEVNDAKDTERYIDLHCQPIDDAIAICKQKIFDIAEISKNEYSQQDFVLAILTANDHMMSVDRSSPLKNVIHGMIKHEMMLDHYYLPKERTILVRVTPDTIDNPVLKEW